MTKNKNFEFTQTHQIHYSKMRTQKGTLSDKHSLVKLTKSRLKDETFVRHKFLSDELLIQYCNKSGKGQRKLIETPLSKEKFVRRISFPTNFYLPR